MSNLESRFVSKFDIDFISGCWNWIAGCSQSGYGVFNLTEGKQIAAHRYVFSEYISEIPKGIFVCHKCDNRKCINPDHLFLGTHTDNMRDMINKGRHRGKLTWGKVREIRRLKGKKRYKKIGREFGIGENHVYKIMSSECWKEV